MFKTLSLICAGACTTVVAAWLAVVHRDFSTIADIREKHLRGIWIAWSQHCGDQGSGSLSQDIVDGVKLLHIADDSMYRSKERGKDSITVAGPQKPPAR